MDKNELEVQPTSVVGNTCAEDVAYLGALDTGTMGDDLEFSREPVSLCRFRLPFPEFTRSGFNCVTSLRTVLPAAGDTLHER